MGEQIPTPPTGDDENASSKRGGEWEARHVPNKEPGANLLDWSSVLDTHRLFTDGIAAFYSSPLLDLRFKSQLAAAASASAGLRAVGESKMGQRIAMAAAISPGIDAIVGLVRWQEEMASSLASVSSAALPHAMDEQLVAMLSQSGFATGVLAGLTSEYGPSSIAVRQGELLAGSYLHFSERLLGHDPARLVTDREAPYLVAGAGLGTIAFAAGVASLDGLAGTEQSSAPLVVLTQPNVYDVCSTSLIAAVRT